MPTDKDRAEIQEIIDKLEFLETVTPYESLSKDPSKFIHILDVTKNEGVFFPGMQNLHAVELARISQIAVITMCGISWTPSKYGLEYSMACRDCLHASIEALKRELGS